MHTKTTAILAGVVTMGAGAAIAEAQSAPTCAFDAATATVTVTVNGGIPVEVQVDDATGAIQMNGVACGGAMVTSTDTVLVIGGTLLDRVVLSGSFAPGLTAESDGNSEIEIAVSLGGTGNQDRVYFNFTNHHDRAYFTAAGVDLGADLDEDISLGGTRYVEMDMRGGNDVVDASAYAVPGGVYVIGGSGDDRLIGTTSSDIFYGDAGNDVLLAGAGEDWLYGGPGDDIIRAGDGDDRLYAGFSGDGRDEMYGSGGTDRVDYGGRTDYVTLILNNGVADDGADGENDLVEGIENVTGGRGGNLIVGTDEPNSINGGPGADEIYGGGGDDVINGFSGPDILVGDTGNDTLNGGNAPDSLDGGGGADQLRGGPARDILTGGPGHDTLFGDDSDDTIYNAGDAMADQVYCGAGTDDAEPDPLDTFTACEL